MMDLFLRLYIISPHWTLENQFLNIHVGLFMEDFGHVVPSDNFWYHGFVIDIQTQVSGSFARGAINISGKQISPLRFYT